MESHHEQRAHAPCLMQSHEWVATLRTRGVPAQIIPVAGPDDIEIGQTALITRSVPLLAGLAFTSRGPIWNSGEPDAAKIAALKTLRRKGLCLANADTAQAPLFRAAGFHRIVTAPTMAALAIRNDWRAQATTKWRNQLRQAQKHSIQTQHCDFSPGDHGWVLRAAQDQAKAKRYRDLPAGFVAQYAATNPGSARVFWAADKDGPIAAVVILRHGSAATYQIGWNSPKARQLNISRLLLAQAVVGSPHKGARGWIWA